VNLADLSHVLAPREEQLLASVSALPGPFLSHFRHYAMS
jgi:hypothetical protein